ncbi:MAG: hypothetical protein JNL50_02925 [Phycisphaerae bacterium]|nr:hypothetical protein [Phycisphaerae bacterium]
MPSPRYRTRFGGLTVVAASLALLFAALDTLTIFGALYASTNTPNWRGGFDIALTRGCLWLRTGDGFQRDGSWRWYAPQPRRWLPATNRYSISGALNWRETLVPLWMFWGGAITTAIVIGPLTRARHRRRGLCLRCGYSLAGLAPHAPCPECGRRPHADSLDSDSTHLPSA